MCLEIISPRFDIFRNDWESPHWRGARKNYEEALKAAIFMTFEDHADYFISNVHTGEQTAVVFVATQQHSRPQPSR
jgi:hypothetical protein